MSRFLLVALLALATVVLAIPTTIGSMSRQPAPPPAQDGADAILVNVFFPKTQKVEAIPLGEYLMGVVAGEMPPGFETEALKAQFVVARTYVVRRMKRFGGKGGCPLNPAADICADHTTGQAYVSLAELVQKSGKLTAEAFWHRLSQAESATAGQVLTYQGELIDSLYHSVSGRMTENAGDYFGNTVPYLVSVDDRWGVDAPRLVEQKRFSPDEFATALAAGGASPALAVTAAARSGRSPVEVVERTAAGRVKSLRVGGLTLTGREFRERLGLRSTDVKVSLEDGEIVVETLGSGHGVGMSQYGADGMARAGKGYEDILTHYYKGVSLVHLFES